MKSTKEFLKKYWYLIAGVIAVVSYSIFNRSSNSKLIGDIQKDATEGIISLREEKTADAVESLEKAKEAEDEAYGLSLEEIEENEKIDDMSEDDFLNHLNRK